MQPYCVISVSAVGMDATGGHGCKVKNLRKSRFAGYRHREYSQSHEFENDGTEHGIITEL